jgi:hypothetical protein
MGAAQIMPYLSQHLPVRLAWTSKMYGGKFKDEQPETITLEQWKEIERYLASGTAEGWSLV